MQLADKIDEPRRIADDYHRLDGGGSMAVFGIAEPHKRSSS
jgi:hypothetical protein